VFAAQEEIALTLVGGEASLAAGIGDAFIANELKIVAPTAAAARLETSKGFAKDFMQRHTIPTARFRTVETFEAARDVLRGDEFGARETPVVIKADGLAAGKGVVVAATKREAEEAAAELLEIPASAGSGQNRLVIEESLTGREASLLLWTDGRDYRLMPPAQDHKRVGTGDTGSNTGGMGAVTAPNILDEEMQKRIVREVVEPTLEGIQAEKLDFRGVLYIGLMMTADGVRVLEYNVRFGDPEAQAILVRLESDLVEISEAVATRRLGETKVSWSKDSSACVVLAARGYPGKVEAGARIEGLEAEANDSSLKIFHSGTRRADDGTWQTAGGRVLGVTACAVTLDDALSRCYGRIKNISWDGMHFRTDIGRGLPD
jgi:phosphoribosylamine--glycine ligase